LAVFISVFAKYFCHFIAGIIFWGSYAPKGMSPVLYSLFVDGGSFLFNLVLAGIVVVALERKADRIFALSYFDIFIVWKFYCNFHAIFLTNIAFCFKKITDYIKIRSNILRRWIHG